MAHILPTEAMRRIRNGDNRPSAHRVVRRPRAAGNSTSDPSGRPAGEAENSYQPSPMDVVLTRELLVRRLGLPFEVVNVVLDFAEYWVCSSNEIDYEVEHGNPLTVTGSSRNEDKFLIRSFPIGLLGANNPTNLSDELAYDLNQAQPKTLSKEHPKKFFAGLARYPMPKLEHPVRKVVFTIRSHDQGRSDREADHGTYSGSWTWFEAGLERFDAEQECTPECTYDVRHRSNTTPAPSLPVCALRSIYPPVDPGTNQFTHQLNPQEKHTICRNKCADKAWQDRQITWSYLDNDEEEPGELGRGAKTADGQFVRSLKMGDVVTIWGKSRFRAWLNHVERVRVDVYWAV